MDLLLLSRMDELLVTTHPLLATWREPWRWRLLARPAPVVPKVCPPPVSPEATEASLHLRIQSATRAERGFETCSAANRSLEKSDPLAFALANTRGMLPPSKDTKGRALVHLG